MLRADVRSIHFRELFKTRQIHIRLKPVNPMDKGGGQWEVTIKNRFRVSCWSEKNVWS
jgi:hypothetical protein